MYKPFPCVLDFIVIPFPSWLLPMKRNLYSPFVHTMGSSRSVPFPRHEIVSRGALYWYGYNIGTAHIYLCVLLLTWIRRIHTYWTWVTGNLLM